MGRTNTVMAAFNRGEVGRSVLGRVDVDRLRLSAETQVNWMPRVAGPMTLRPGLGFVDRIKAGATAIRHLPFVFSMTDQAIIEATPGAMRVRVDEVLISRLAVTATFAGNLSAPTGWTVASTGGGSFTISGGQMTLSGQNYGGYVRATNQAAINEIGTEHALRITVDVGFVTFKVGTVDNTDDVIRETVLSKGTHSLAFTPTTASVYVQFESSTVRQGVVSGFQLEGTGPMEVPAFWTATLLPYLRIEQSGDVVFFAAYGVPLYRIERRGTRSWSLVRFEPDDGPFAAFPSKAAKIVFAASLGFTQVIADRPLFKPGHVGALLRAYTPNYNHTFTVGAERTYTPAIRVTGVGADRGFNFSVAGTFTGTWVLERSFDSEDAGFAQVSSGTAPGATSLVDGLNNSIVWYRLGFGASYTSGLATFYFDRQGGGRTGICRIRSVAADGLTAIAEVVKPFSSIVATDDWRFGEWSDVAGWPSAVTIHDGRLWFAGRDRLWSSVSDGYASFADTLDGEKVGDSSAISRSIGYGPVAVINWLLGLTRLLAGAEGSEISIRSSSLDAPLTPTGGLAIRDCSTQGSARMPAVKVDTRGLFVQKSGQRLYQLLYDVNSQDYQSNDLTRLHPDMNKGNPIVQVVVQRQPDTRIHCRRQDGTVYVLTFEPTDEVVAWWRVETDGVVTDMLVLPDTVEDRVYYTVRRTTTAGTVESLERFARLDECQGDAITKLADAHVTYAGAPTTTLSGLSHLEGRTVVVWADGKDVGTKVVTGGQITLDAPASAIVAGLGYSARFRSAKLAYAAVGGSALTQQKRINRVGLIMSNTHAQGVRFGQTFDVMDGLPQVEREQTVDPNYVWTDYDLPMIEVPGDWDTDARLCLAAAAPRPATINAVVIDITTNG